MRHAITARLKREQDEQVAGRTARLTVAVTVTTVLGTKRVSMRLTLSRKMDQNFSR